MILKENIRFAGFPDLRSNVTFVPIQFFTVVIPHSSRGTIRIVGYVLRKLLGWVDEAGNPRQEQLRFTYRELVRAAGVSRNLVGEALEEAVESHYLRCVRSVRGHSAGRRAQSAIYELCWDPEPRCCHKPEFFRGFCYPEAAVVEEEEGPRSIQRPKSSRKNIPNAFFDYLIPREKKSVIRVVGALLFYSIQWGPAGERKVPLQRSITELKRLTGLSRHHVHAGVAEACRRGYLEQLDAGCFDPAAGQSSRAATYGIRWSAGPSAETTAETERPQKVNGTTASKGERNRPKKVNGERHEMVNGINITTEHKTLQATATPVEPGASAPGAAVSGCDLLRKAGFDDPTARFLAKRHSLDVIQRQIEWLPLRGAARNRLGLLRRAIEQDWPKPEGAPEGTGAKLGRLFASHYYAGYHGYVGDAATEPFPKDLELASKIVARLLAQHNDEKLVPEWGRRFGRLLRDKHQGDAKAKPNLSTALVLYGDRFLRVLQGETSTRRKEGLGKAQEARQAARWPEYLAYLRFAESNARQAAPELYAAFTEERQRTRLAMTGRLFQAAPETLAKFDREESRLLAFAEFFRDHPQQPVLDFAQWDNQPNSPPKPAEAVADKRMSVRFSPTAATEGGETAAVVGVRGHPPASGTEP